MERRGAEYTVSDDPAIVADAGASILPGDGAFGAVMHALEERGLDTAIRLSIARERPFLGICVGMQVLFDGSTEHGEHGGLGIFPGRVVRFEHAPRVPHLGWNELEPVRAHPFVAGIERGEYAYFLHSYRVDIGEFTLAASEHGERFAAIVGRAHVMGTQFHPEKSQHTGAKLLDNFLRIARG